MILINIFICIYYIIFYIYILYLYIGDFHMMKPGYIGELYM